MNRLFSLNILSWYLIRVILISSKHGKNIYNCDYSHPLSIKKIFYVVLTYRKFFGRHIFNSLTKVSILIYFFHIYFPIHTFICISNTKS